MIRIHTGAFNEVDEAVLFSFDDHCLPWRHNLKLAMHKPDKYEGNPVLTPGPPGSVDDYGAFAYGTTLKEGDLWRMWYVAWHLPDPRWPEEYFVRPIAYAESRDGIHWEKPNLGLVEFRGSRDNNIVLIEPQEHPYALRPFDFISIIADEDDPDPHRRYKMAYIALPGKGFGHIATASSGDGLRWKLENEDRIIKGHFEVTSLTKFGGVYYLSGQNIGPDDMPKGREDPDTSWGVKLDGSSAGRVTTTVFSSDFKSWSDGRALSMYRHHYERKPAGYGEEMHMGITKWNRGNVVLGNFGIWHGSDVYWQGGATHARVDLGFALSNDGIHFRQPIEDFTFISRGDTGEWDEHAVLQSNSFINQGDKTCIYYGSWNSEESWPPSKPAGTCIQGTGLAVLRRDGFGSITKLVPGETSHVASAPISANAPVAVTANLEGSGLLFEIVDIGDKPIPGFSRDECLPLESSVNTRIRWENADVVDLRQPFRVKAVWKDNNDQASQLFAIYLSTRR